MIAKIVFILFGVLLAIDMYVLQFTNEIEEGTRKDKVVKDGFLCFGLSLILLVSGLLLC